MSGTKQYFSFNVSEFYFRLTTESIRLHSNRRFQYSTLGEVIDDRAQCLCDMADRYDGSDMREHLRIIPSEGLKPLDFSIEVTSGDIIERFLPVLGVTIGSPVKAQDAISLLLYDFIVAANATELLTKLGLPPDEVQNYRVCLKKGASNVIPFR